MGGRGARGKLGGGGGDGYDGDDNDDVMKLNNFIHLLFRAVLLKILLGGVVLVESCSS